MGKWCFLNNSNKNNCKINSAGQKAFGACWNDIWAMVASACPNGKLWKWFSLHPEHEWVLSLIRFDMVV